MSSWMARATRAISPTGSWVVNVTANETSSGSMPCATSVLSSSPIPVAVQSIGCGLTSGLLNTSA